MRPAEVGEAVRFILGTWPVFAAKVDREAMTLSWGVALMDLDFDEVKAAVVEIAKTEHFFTSIAAIRAHVVAMHHGERRPGGDAWGEVLRCRSPRQTADLERMEPAIVRCLDSLGMIRRYTVDRGGRSVGRWYVALGDNESADRARFIELYDQVSGQLRKLVQLSPGAKVQSLNRAETTQSLGGIVRGLLTTTTTEEDDDGDSDE